MVKQLKPIRRVGGKRTWMIAAGLIAIILAFRIWHRHAGHAGTLATTPEELEQRARENPDDFAAQLGWGEALAQHKRLGAAVEVLTRARQLAPNDARPYAWLGVVAMYSRRTDDAQDLIREALRRDPANTTAIRAQANLDAQEHRLRSAIHGFERLVQLRPNDADAWQRLGLLLIGVRENYRSLDALARSAVLDPSDMLTQRVLGNVAVQAGRLDQASNAFHAVLGQDPNDPEALSGLAKVMMRQDPSPAGLAAAEKQADMALNAAQAPEAYSTRGQIRMTQRRWREAVEDFKAAVALSPRNREYYVFLSQCYAGAGQPARARQASADFDRLTAEQLTKDRMPARSRQAEQKAIR